MSIRCSEDFKKEVVKAYMAGDKSIHQLAVEFNVAKSSVNKWANEYREECLYTTNTTSESNDAKEIRRLNQLLNKKDAKREYHKRLEHIFELIKYVYYNNNRVIGYRAMRIFIKRYGYELSNTTMHKYMNKELNLCAVIMHSKPGYKAGKKNKIFDNLLNQNFTVDCKNKVWCTDFTYMRQPNGKFRYNCSIIDLYDRSAVASLNSDYINTALAINTLKMVLKKENYPKVILHSDQGVQFTSWEFVKFCKENNVIQSMSRSGCPYDNAPMERFYNTFKSNFYNVTAFSSVEMMDELTMKYINWYNYVRPHSYNDYLTPMEARYI